MKDNMTNRFAEMGGAMPITAEWLNEGHTVIRIHLHDPWELSEYFQAVTHTHTLMSGVTHPVHLVYDLTDSFNVPLNLLSSIRAIEKRFVPPQGITVCVKTSPYLRAVMRMGIRVFPHLGRNLFFADRLEDAYALIEKYENRSSLQG
jgi:hypothetical protein